MQIDRAFSRLAVLVVLSTGLLVFPWLRYGYERYSIPKNLALALAAATAAFLWARAPKITVRAIDVCAIGYLAAGVISWTANDHHLASLGGWLSLYLSALLIFYASRRATEKDEVLDAVVIAAAIVALIAVLEASGLHLPWGGSRRPIGSIGHRNYLAAYVAGALPIAVARSIAVPAISRAGVVALMVIVVVVCRARSVWIGCGVAALIAVALAVRARASPRPALLAASAILAGVLLAGLVPWPGLRWKEDRPLLASVERIAEHDQGSGRVRIDQHRLGFAIWRPKPLFGVGPGGWDDAANEHAHAIAGKHARRWSVVPPKSPVSDFLQVLSATGAIGVLFVAGVLFTFAFDLRSSSIVCAIAVTIVHGLFDAPFSRTPQLVQVVVLAGLLGGNALAIRTFEVRSSIARTAAVVLAILVVTAPVLELIAVSVSHRGGYSIEARRAAMRWFPRAQDAQQIVIKTGDQCTASLELEWLMKEAPHRWGAHQQAARCSSGDEARRLLERAIEIEPHNRGLKRRLEQVR